MASEINRIRCQRCRAVNQLGSETCSRCGTPLMLIVASTAHRYVDLATPEPHGEHLLERISVLEYQLARSLGISERAVDIALRQSETTRAICDLLERLTTRIAELQEEVAELRGSKTAPAARPASKPAAKNRQKNGGAAGRAAKAAKARRESETPRDDPPRRTRRIKSAASR